MLRIPRLRIQLRALLLMVLLLEPCAFTFDAPHRSPFAAIRSTSSRRGRFLTGRGEDFDTFNILDVPSQRQRAERWPRVDINTLNKSGSRLPWASLLVVLLCAQIFGKTPLSPDTVAYSAVSAMLLRSYSHGPNWKQSIQSISLAAVVAWQVISQAGNVLSWLQFASSGFSAWYLSCLSSFPLPTKALTTATIALVGDMAAQLIEERIRANRENTSFQFNGRYDRRRGLAIVADGALVTGPLLHFAYNFLETMIPIHGAATGLAATLAAFAHVLIDDFILDAAFVAIMFVTTGLGEGYQIREILSQFRKDYVGAIKTSWTTSILLMPFEFVLFRFFPLSFRVLGMNFIDIIWEGTISYVLHRRRRGDIQDDDIEEDESNVPLPFDESLELPPAQA